MTDYKPHFLALGILLPCVASLFIYFRLQAKRFRNRSKPFKLSADDYCIIVALIISYGWSVNIIIGSRLGNLGGHSDLGEDGWLQEGKTTLIFMKTDFIASLLVNPAMGFIKMSVVILYGRIFNSYRFEWMTKVLVGILAAWTIAFTLGYLFACWPIETEWTVLSNEGCVDLYSLYMGGTISNTVTDVIVLSWPVLEVSRIKMPLRRKLGVIFMFLLGGLVTITGILRIYYLVNAHEALMNPDGTDVNYMYSLPMLWTIVEINIGIVCACLPILRPLYKAYHINTAFSSMRSALSTPLLRFRGPNASSNLQIPAARFTIPSSEHMVEKKSESPGRVELV